MTLELNEIPISEHAEGKILEVNVTGKLGAADYEAFAPQVERLIKEHGKIRMLVHIHDFHGWTAGGLWKDLKFAWKHANDIERLAVVGETRWQEGMVAFSRPFTSAKVKYFEQDQLDAARRWVEV